MNDLDQLKELLFGAEKEALDSIAERVGRREVRTIDVADVLPEAIEESYNKDGQLVESLTKPVGDCLQRALHEEPEAYADALYPVMGPAIRKSIMHALRNFSQQISEAVEHSVTPKGLKWRWQASRAGVPFGEYVLQQTMRYRVEQAYLISRENGLLVSHVHHEASKIKDSDAVSAMFTAIQDFVKESFSPDRSGRLESADMGEFTLWAVHGPHALLVCVIRGVPPKRLRADLSAILERIHFRYGEAIRDYKGDTSSVPDVEVELQRCLRFEAREETGTERKGAPRWMLLMLLLLVFAGGFLAYRSWVFSQQLERLTVALDSTPGIHVTHSERDGGFFTIRGLRDPLARSVAEVAEDAEVPVNRIRVSMQPFQSLKPEMVLARAELVMSPPDSVRLDVSGTTLTATGVASAEWLQQLQTNFRQIAGVTALDAGAVRPIEQSALTDRVSGLSGRRFFFLRDVDFVPGDREALQGYVATLQQLQSEAGQSGAEIRVTLTGSTDAIGDAAANVLLAERRALAAARVFADAGIEAEVARLSVIPEISDERQEDPGKRHVQADLEIRRLTQTQ